MIQQRNPEFVKVWEVKEAGHAGAWRVAPQEYARQIAEFLEADEK
jgi:hypothetical protein